MHAACGNLPSWLRDKGDIPLFVGALFVKTVGFTVQHQMSIGPWMPWITVLLLVVFVSLHFLGPRLLRRLGLFVVGTALSLLILADVVQMRFTREVITIPALMQAGQLFDVKDAVLEYMYLGDLWYLADVPIWLIYLGATWRSPNCHRRKAAAPSVRWAARLAPLPVSLVLFGLSYTAAKAANQGSFQVLFNSRQQVETLGILGFHTHDVYVYLVDRWWPGSLDDTELDEIYHWYERRPDDGAALVPFGVAAGKNLIFLQIESLQEFVIGLKVNGQEVTPTLNKFRNESIYFAYCFDQTHNGRSSDCDFTAFTSLHPVHGSGAVVYQYGQNRFDGLPQLLLERGYTTFAACAFWEDFWNMTRMHRNYGFRRHLYTPSDSREHAGYVKYLVKDDLLPRTDNPEYQRGWLSDRSFLRQTLAEMKTLPQPFLAYAITIISHNPYDFIPQEEMELTLPPELRPHGKGSFAGRFLQHIRWVDRVLGEFFEALKAEGLYEDSVIVVLGDHDAGFQDYQLEHLGRVIGKDWNIYLMDRVPLFIRLPGGAYAENRTTVCGQMDVAPSLCHLMGIPRKGTFFMGHNLFRDNGNAVVPFRDGSFADQHHLYRNIGKTFESGECFDLRTGRLLNNPAVCRDSYDEAYYRLVLSDKVLKYDLLPELRKRFKERQSLE